MTRIQLHLTADQGRRLETLAKDRRTTRAALIREGIELLLGTVEEEPLLALVGQAGRDRSPDTSADHDRVLAASKRATR